MKTRNIRSKCACYVGGIGICLCTISMSLGLIGITTVEISKSGNIQDNNNMDNMGGIMTTTKELNRV